MFLIFFINIVVMRFFVLFTNQLGVYGKQVQLFKCSPSSMHLEHESKPDCILILKVKDFAEASIENPSITTLISVPSIFIPFLNGLPQKPTLLSIYLNHKVFNFLNKY